jgi:two-component system, cell cycle response regulator DivK
LHRLKSNFTFRQDCRHELCGNLPDDPPKAGKSASLAKFEKYLHIVAARNEVYTDALYLREIGIFGHFSMSFKILIVEDNADSRNLLHFILTGKGYTVATAIDGAEGVYMAKVEVPDLLITDMMMPNVDGIELIKQIRAEAETAAMPILVYTAYGTETVEMAIAAGANQSFYKPIDLDRMLEYIEELLPSAKEPDQ